MRAVSELDDFERKIVDNVREHGCQVNAVFDPNGATHNFSYSIGFPESVAQPEVITFGLSVDMMNFMINETLHQCRAGLVLTDWLAVHGLLEGHRCVLREVRPEHIVRDYLNSAMWHHQWRTGLPLKSVMQIVWPGAVDGLFPWDKDCSAIVIESQPALYEGALH